MTLPLEGTKVLDVSRLLPGPFCSMMLGDMGAEVIKVNELPSGEGRRAQQSQGVPQLPTPTHEEMVLRTAYSATHRNKRSIMLNLKSREGQEVLHRLAASSDIFLEEFRPGVSKRLGADYETLSRINPRLIYCSISLYGQDGPYARVPGHDPIARAVAGMLDAGRYPDGRPIMIAVPFVDVSAALHGTIGILFALQAREKTGRGQHVDISMTDSALDFMVGSLQRVLQESRVTEAPRPRAVNSGAWKTKDDKWVCTTNVESHHWANLCRAVGREDLIPYQWAEGEKAEEIHTTLKEVFESKTREEWFRLSQEVDTQIAPVLEMAEVAQDPQILHRQMVLELDHPSLGKVKQLGISVKLSDTPGQVRRFAPLPGEHTREILESIGYSPKDIQELEGKGAAAAHTPG